MKYLKCLLAAALILALLAGVGMGFIYALGARWLPLPPYWHGKSVILTLTAQGSSRPSWASAGESSQAWQSWAHGARIILLPVKDGKPIVALYNPFLNDAVFMRIGWNFYVQEYGYYIFPRASYHRQEPLLNLDGVVKNFRATRVLMLQMAANSEEGKFFEQRPDPNRSLKTDPLLAYALAAEADIDTALQYTLHPFFTDGFDSKNVAKYAGNRPGFKVLQEINKDPADWGRYIGNAWKRQDKGIISGILFDSYADTPWMLLLAFRQDNNEIVNVDAACLDVGGKCTPELVQ
ncbi:MAG: hypothetical protein AB7G80_03580 [Dongiaceae bacterium]